MKYVQNSWMPAFLVCFIYSRVLVAFLNFRIVKSVIFLGQKKKRPALNVFVISWTTPCQNSMSNLKLRAASPISGCGRGLAGPARRGCKSSNLKMIILLKNSGTSRRPFLTRQGGNSTTSQRRRQTTWNLVRVRKVMKAGHWQGGSVGGCSSGVVWENRIVGSEFSECRRTHRLRISAGESFRSQASKGISGSALQSTRIIMSTLLRIERETIRLKKWTINYHYNTASIS